jgi:hypothetical protein
MAILLLVVGGGWALLGLLNLIGMFGKTTADQTGIQMFGLILNVCLFILPGLVLAGIGALLKRRASDRTEEANRAEAGLRSRENEIERRVEEGIRKGLDSTAKDA